MDNFLNDLSTPGWWLGVVVVGVAINLFSGWLAPRIARRTTQFSGLLGRVSEKLASAYRKEVGLIRADRWYFTQVSLAEMRARHQATLYLLSGGFGAIVVNLKREDLLPGGLYTSLAFLTSVLIFLGVRSYALANLKASQLAASQEPPYEA